MFKYTQYILLLCAYTLYYNSPYQYSYPFCQSCFIIFIINAILTCQTSYKQNKTLLTFDIIFTFAFFYTNYVYGLVLYIVNPYFSLFKLDFNENYICKGVALATLGYSAYSIGRCSKIFSREKFNDISISLQKFKFIKQTVLIFSLITMLLIIPKLGMNYNEDDALEFGTIGNYIYNLTFIFTYFILIIEFSKYKKKPKQIFNENLIFCLVIIVLNLGLLSIGSRTIPLRLSLLCIFLYNLFTKKISSKYILVGGAVGMFIMYFVGATREGGNADSISENPLVEMGNELIINNRSLFVLVEHGDLKGLTYGKTMLMNVLSVIPFGQSIFLNITGSSEADINSANLVTDLYFNDKNVDRIIGLGTNVIGDIYVAFGNIGVIILMYILGRYINKLNNNYSIKNTIIYAMFICNAIYYTRSGILTPIREVAWILLIYHWCLSKQNKIYQK